jgi:precorrin-3B methylase
MTAKDVEEAVKNVNEENLQREKQLKEAERNAKKQAKEEQQRRDAEEKRRRDAEEWEAEEQEKREAERMRMALEKARKGKKKVVYGEDDPNTVGLAPNQMAASTADDIRRQNPLEDTDYDSVREK